MSRPSEQKRRVVKQAGLRPKPQPGPQGTAEQRAVAQQMPRKKGLGSAPSKRDLKAGRYDRQWLWGPVQGMFLGRTTDPVAREAAASGGVLTATLCGLFERGEVDAVLAVGLDPKEPAQPRYLVLASAQAVLAHAGSVYSYIPATELRRAVREAEMAGHTRLAVVCQPCLVPVVRRWQVRGDYGIQAVLSFFCGWNMTYDATGYLLGKAGIRPEEVRSLGYRRGPWPGGFGVTARDGREVRFGKESYELVNMMFLRPGCARCAYYMGEGADLVCGDAWLRNQPDLTSLLARTERGMELLEGVRSRERVELFHLDEETLLRMHWHNLRYKKYGMSPGMQRLTRWFGRPWVQRMAPFRLLSLASRWRRALKMGVDLERLEPVEGPLV
ncbi:MAG: Coenzyme F420 hydrogenase/dehydrogenase, beta subunit C-terminal domain [Desulfovibrio sp.]